MAEGERSEPLPPAQAGGGGFSWPTALGFSFLTFNSGMAVYRSNHVKAAIAFVVSSYVILVALFVCIKLYERAPPGSTTKGKLKVAVWVLTTALILLLSYKIAAIAPVLVQVLVWLMAFATVLGGFYAFFLHNEEKGKTGTDCLLATLRRPPGRRSPGQDPGEAAWSRTRLVVDSGATSHAVGNIWLLEDYQPYNAPLVATLADGSNLRIFGVGHIHRGNFVIPNVSVVEGLQDGLISTPQLDTHHGLISCFGNGVCRIMEANGTEVGGAILEEDGSYVLRFLEVPGPAQV